MRRVVLLILIALSVAFYVHRNFVVAPRYVDASPSDFSHYHEAARAMAEGKSPYEVHNFDYPPLVALVVRPLASMDYADARWSWFLVNQAALLLAALATWLALGRTLGALAAVAATWGLCGTVAENLVLGQIAPVILLLIGIALLTEPALPIGVAAALKIFPGLLLARELFARRWASVGVAVATIALLVVLPIRILAPLPGPALPASTGYWMGSPALLNVSIPAIAWRSVDRPSGETLPHNWVSGDNPASMKPDPSGRLASVVTSVIVLLFGAGIIATMRVEEPDRAVETGAWLVLAVLASPIAWYHYAILLFPAIAAAGLALAESRRYAMLALLAIIAAGVTWSHRFAAGRYVETFGWTAREPLLLYIVTVLPAVSAIALFAVLVSLMRGRDDAAAAARA